MILGSNELASPYAEYYKIPNFLNPDLRKVLMIGGGAYSYPKYFIDNYPSAQIDVVEINPEITKIAKEFFFLKESANLKIYHEDGRVFLNKTTEKYDAILMDAFNGFSIPYQLTTREFLNSINEHLTKNGVVVVNLPGLLEGDGSEFIYAQYKTYKEVFSEVDLFLVRESNNRKKFQNIMLVARKTKGNLPIIFNDEYNYMLDHIFKGKLEKENTIILTDNFAPVNFLTKGLDKYF